MNVSETTSETATSEALSSQVEITNDSSGYTSISAFFIILIIFLFV